MKPRVVKMTVRMETLDGSLPAGYVPALIKMDVEGAERLVIEGAIETISKCKPIVVFEHGRAADYYDTQPCHIYELLHDEALSVTDLMQSVFPNLHYIWIKRSDKVRQAVSHAKARQTDVWKMVTETKPLLTTKPAFSFKQIDFMVQQLEAQEAAWQKYFAVNGIQPFIVVYEHFVQKYEDTAIQILEYLDISGAEYLEFAPRRMKKQSNEESERWVQRYHYLKMQGKRYRIISYANRLLLTFLQTASHRIN